MDLGPAVRKFSAAAAQYDRPILVMGPLIPSQGIEVYNDSSKNVVVVVVVVVVVIVVVAVAVVVLMIFYAPLVHWCLHIFKL